MVVEALNTREWWNTEEIAAATAAAAAIAAAGGGDSNVDSDTHPDSDSLVDDQ